MFSAITAFFTSLNQAIKTYETHILEQSTSDVVKSKTRLKKATDVTEEILEITDKYASTFEGRDLLKYNKLKKKFLKLN